MSANLTGRFSDGYIFCASGAFRPRAEAEHNPGRVEGKAIGLTRWAGQVNALQPLARSWWHCVERRLHRFGSERLLLRRFERGQGSWPSKSPYMIRAPRPWGRYPTFRREP